MNSPADPASIPDSAPAAGSPRLLHEIFRRTALRWPERVALEIPPGSERPARHSLTYSELEAASDQLAAWIAPQVNADSVVALAIPRTDPWLFIGQLAVLKAGAAYTCLDAAFPDGQVAEILCDAASTLLLTDEAGVARAARAGWSGVHPIIPGTLARNDTMLVPRVSVEPQHLAYLIYTSGTTGRPKGVMIEHRSVVNLVDSDLEAFRLTPSDRVAQGSSAAYDSSVEELWLAWAAGAAAVVMDDEAARLGPDLVPWLQRERISVLCPPPTLLRTTGCDRPWEALPDLRLLYVGGEALPQDVADRWGRGCQLVNGYGPTECTVTSVRGPIRPGDPITIGRPVRGVVAWILDDALQPVPDGAEGELCLGGVALARGYRNLPEVTAEKFPTLHGLGRIYRTGDLVVRGPDGILTCLGRVDAQVKIRGYRIELEAIEARLSECEGVRAAACAVRGDTGAERLVAFVVPVDASVAMEPARLQRWLGAVLPPYMVPGIFVAIESLPRSVGGKIQRRALPEVRDLAGAVWLDPEGEPNAGRTAESPVERALAGACAQALRRESGAVLPVDADFFSGLGGDSLTAALWISRLRELPETASLTVRDIYECRTIAALAQRAATGAGSSETGDAAIAGGGEDVTAGQRLFATCLQAASIAVNLVVLSALLYVTAFWVLPWLVAVLGWVPLVLGFPGLMFLVLCVYTPISIALAVGFKRLLIGRYRPGREPVWGSFYLRHWTVLQMVRRVPWGFLEGTELLNMALRALGARIGKRVHIHRGVDLFRGGWDLLEIGDDVTLSEEASIRLVELEARQLVMGPVVLEAGCTLATRAGVGGETRVGTGAVLTPLSSLARGASIPAGERWDGIPARRVGEALPAPAVTESGPVLSPLSHAVAMLLVRLATSWILALPLELAALAFAHWSGVDAEAALDWMESPHLSVRGVLAATATFLAPVPLSLLLEAALCRALGRVEAGVMSRYGWSYLRVWTKTGLVQSAGNWLYGTLFWPWWLRWAGARLGEDVEISTIIDVVPEMLEIGSKSFLADGLYLGGPRIHQGTVTVAPIRLGERTFLGNGAVVPAGELLPPDLLLGVLTVGEARTCRPGSAWFGHPAFELPRREVLEVDVHLTHRPSVLRRVNRLFWEGLRFLIPFVPAAVVPLWCGMLAWLGAGRGFWGMLWIAAPVATAVAGMAPCVFVIALKWLLLGRVRPGVHPLWSCWASRWDFVCLAWSLLARDVIGVLDGTLMQAWFLRCLGVTVGRGVVLGPGFAQDIPDPDMLHLGDGATVDGFFQAHTFEDRVLKIDHVFIGAGATIGTNAVLLYGADIGAGSRVEPHSVVMKRERLLPGSVYEGCPTRRIGAASR